MKFARQFQADLQGYPPEWVGAAINYNGLKKCLKSVQRDLQVLGLDEATLRQLLNARAAESTDGSKSGVRYKIEGVYACCLARLDSRPKPTLDSDGLGKPSTVYRHHPV